MDRWPIYFRHAGWIAGLVLAMGVASGCASWSSRQQEAPRPSPPLRSQFRRDPPDKPSYFFDEKAKEIEASLGVGGEPRGF